MNIYKHQRLKIFIKIFMFEFVIDMIKFSKYFHSLKLFIIDIYNNVWLIFFLLVYDIIFVRECKTFNLKLT